MSLNAVTPTGVLAKAEASWSNSPLVNCSFDPTICSLDEYLGSAAEYLDLVAQPLQRLLLLLRIGPIDIQRGLEALAFE